MRSVGFALLALTVGVTALHGQQPVVPATPAVPPAVPAAADPILDAHLAGWEKKMAEVTNFRFDLELKRTDPAAGIFKGEQNYKGSILGMKPTLARLRLDNVAEPKNPNDFEAFICDGKSVYAYNGLQKSITEHKLPDPKANPAGATDNLILDFVSGMKARDLKDRFGLQVFKEDAHYVYLDIKPKLGKDKQEFNQLRLALYGPKTQVAYLPAQVFMVKPNGETEQWKLSNPQTNIPGLDPKKIFAYEPVPGFTLQQAPPTRPAPAAVRPGQPTPPVGRP